MIKIHCHTEGKARSIHTKNGEWIAEFMDFRYAQNDNVGFCYNYALQPVESLCANALYSK